MTGRRRSSIRHMRMLGSMAQYGDCRCPRVVFGQEPPGRRLLTAPAMASHTIILRRFMVFARKQECGAPTRLGAGDWRLSPAPTGVAEPGKAKQQHRPCGGFRDRALDENETE
jgi:hypothetical protein